MKNSLMKPVVKAYLMADENNIINLTESDEKSLSDESLNLSHGHHDDHDINNPAHALSQEHILQLL